MEASENLADVYRQTYRATFREQVLAGNKVPLFIHLYILSSHLIPAAYLAVPHRHRPWLYQTRWLVLAATTTLQLWTIFNCSSVSFASAYSAGLLSSWGIIWNLALLVWTRPQWDAKRVQRTQSHDSKISGMERRNRAKHERNSKSSSTLPYESNTSSVHGHMSDKLRVRQRVQYTYEGEEDAAHVVPNGLANESASPTVTSSKAEIFDYKWQSFPEDAPFVTRFAWALGLTTTLRFTGWNWAISVLPPYLPPPILESGIQLPLRSLPNRSRQGYTRFTSRKELLIHRLLLNIIPSYLILDFLATFMTQDPYFIIGPNNLPLSLRWSSIPPIVLSFTRALMCFAGVLGALHFIWNSGALLVAFLGPPVLGLRADPWHLPSLNGSFERVLDRGLAGFWGEWWHQSFRFGLTAPTQWMIRNGYLRRGSSLAHIVGTLVAFMQSGFLHAAGSFTTIPSTKPWNPFIFFVFAGAATLLQHGLAVVFRPYIMKLPIGTRRAGNLVFTFACLFAVSGFLFDDFGRSGLWLFEPVPFSVARWLGYGTPGDKVWRLSRDDCPRWYTGRHWWDTGIAI